MRRKIVLCLIAVMTLGSSISVNAQTVIDKVGELEYEDDGMYAEVNVNIEENTSIDIDKLQYNILKALELDGDMQASNFEFNVPVSPYILLMENELQAVSTGSEEIIMDSDGCSIVVTINVVPNTSGEYNEQISINNQIVNGTNEPYKDNSITTSTDNIGSLSGSGENDSQSKVTEDNEQLNTEQPTETDNSSPIQEPTQEPVQEPVQEPINSEQPIIQNAFTDISHRQWAINAINNMANKGFLKGVGGNLFKPDNNCKRCDFVIADVRMADLKAQSLSELSFNDVPSDAYYALYLQIAVDNGIISNTSLFRPTDDITREEAAVVIYNTLVSKGKITPTETTSLSGTYADASSINQSYIKAVATLTENSLMVGTAQNKFDPKSKITRAQMAVLLNNVYEAIQ